VVYDKKNGGIYKLIFIRTPIFVEFRFKKFSKLYDTFFISHK